MQDTDEALYREVRRGSEAALTEIVHRYHAPLLRFLHRLTDNRMSAEDLVQETFTRLIIYRGEPPHNFRIWAYTVARNLARDQFKSAYFRLEESESFEDWDERRPMSAADNSLEETVAAVMQRHEINLLLQQLPAAAHEVLVLRFYHDLSLEQIGAVVGLPLGTVKSRLFNALKTLKTLLHAEITP